VEFQQLLIDGTSDAIINIDRNGAGDDAIINLKTATVSQWILGTRATTAFEIYNDATNKTLLSASLSTDDITLHPDTILKVDDIIESTGDHGVEIETNLFKDGAVYPGADANNYLNTTDSTLNFNAQGNYKFNGCSANGNSNIQVSKAATSDVCCMSFNNSVSTYWRVGMEVSQTAFTINSIIGTDTSIISLHATNFDCTFHANTLLQTTGTLNNSITSAQDVEIDASGYLGYVSSIRKSKMDINNLDGFDFSNYQPVTFKYRKRIKNKDGSVKQYLDKPESNNIQYGLIADDVEKLDKRFCTYNSKGELTGIDYKRFISPLITAVKTLQIDKKNMGEKIQKLENQIEKILEKLEI
jgi:hypothetical protein